MKTVFFLRNRLSKVALHVSQLLPVLALLASCGICYGLPQASDHAELWLYCLGIEDTGGYSVLRADLSKLSTIIDRGIPDEEAHALLKGEIPVIIEKLGDEFKYGIEGPAHRIVFHWGLSVDSLNLGTSTSVEPLRKRLQIRLDISAENLTEPEKNKLLDAYLGIVGKEWSQRQDEFIRGTGRTLGMPTRSAYLPVAVVLYEIHILADFLDSRIADPGPFDYHFNEELLNHGLLALPKSNQCDKLVKLLRASAAATPPINSSKLAELLSKEPEGFQRMFSSKISEDETRRRALHILILLRNALPGILSESYAQELASKGIPLHQEETLLDLFRFWK